MEATSPLSLLAQLLFCCVLPKEFGLDAFQFKPCHQGNRRLNQVNQTHEQNIGWTVVSVELLVGLRRIKGSLHLSATFCFETDLLGTLYSAGFGWFRGLQNALNCCLDTHSSKAPLWNYAIRIQTPLSLPAAPLWTNNLLSLHL